MKKSIALILSLVMAAAVLVSCNGEDGKSDKTTAHTHTFSGEWSMDENNHWYAASCEHVGQKANLAPHDDKNNDGLCDICSYDYGHKHEFSADWSSDDKGHWHAPTCKHDVKSEEGEHKDLDNDGLCDTCKWDYGDSHKHPFKSEWSNDSLKHWHDSSCTHKLTSDEGEHEDEDNNGICDTCLWDYDHTHTFKDSWTQSSDEHWHAPSCTHTVEGAEKGAHIDGDGDRKCDTCAYDLDHTHTFANTWEYDKNTHWHGTSCGHVAKSAEAAHEDLNNDGLCDTCLWDYGHTHTWSESYKHDKNEHWREPTCKHTVTDPQKGEHADTDNDGLCDVCDWDYDHTHIFEETWSYDTNSHWYAASCHNAKGSEAEHTDKNSDGKCDVCMFYISMQSVVDTVLSNSDKINGGKYSYSNDYMGFVDSGETYYTFGKNYLYTVQETDWDKIEMHFTMYNGKLFGVRKTLWKDGGFTETAKPDEMTDEFFKGVVYNGEAVGGTDELRTYGAEELLKGIYAYALEKGIGVAESYDTESGTFTLTFCRYQIYEDGTYGSLYDVLVSFKLSNAGALEKITVISKIYMDYTVEENGNPILNSGAAPITIYSASYEQTMGEHSAECPIDPENVLPTSFDVTDGNGKVVKELTVDLDTLTYLYFENILPANSVFALDNIFVTSSDKNGLDFFYWSGDTSMFITALKPGTYTLTISGINVTKTIKVNVTAPEIEGLVPEIFTEDSNGVYTSTFKTEAVIYLGQTFYFMPAATPFGSNNLCELSCPLLAVKDDMILFEGDAIDVYSVKPTAVGSYVITMVSKENSAISCTLTLNVLEIPSPDEILSGTKYTEMYIGGEYSVQTEIIAKFEPSAIGATNGKVTVTAKTSAGVKSEILSYTFDGTNINVTHVSGDELKLGFRFNSSNGIDVFTAAEEDLSSQSAPMVEYTPSGVIQGSWFSKESVPDGWGGMTTACQLTFGDQSFAYIISVSDSAMPDFSYSVDNESGNITVTFLESYDAEIKSAVLDMESMTLTVVVSINGSDTTYTMTKTAM